MKKHNLWAIIPGYNERNRIGPVIEEVLKQVDEVVVVDDGSRDGTTRVAENYPVNVLRHITNLGKGSALKTGCEFAFANGADRVVLIDSDGQHNPKEIKKVVAPLDKRKDISFGIRTFNDKMPFVMKFGNKFISTSMKLLFGIELKDTQSGFRAFTKKTYEKIKWKSMDYSVESEMIAKAGRAGLKHAQVEIETIYSDDYKGTTVFDGIKILLDLLRWKIIG